MKNDDTKECEFVPKSTFKFATITTPKQAKLPSSQLDPPKDSNGKTAIMKIRADDINPQKIHAQNFQV